MAKSPARVIARLETPETAPQAAPSEGSWGGRRIPRTLDADALTPANINSLLTAAESGDLASQAELFELMEERDGELAAHLRTRKAGVSQADWSIEPADDSPEAQRAADFCGETLEAMSDVDDALFDLLDAVGKGYSVIETIWQTAAKAWTPAELVFRPQRWFNVAEDGRTLTIKGEGVMNADQPMNPLNFIVHRVRAQSGFEYRTGLLRSCIRAWVVRAYSWKDWMAFAEMFGMPMRVGYLREDVDWQSAEARNFWSMLVGMGTDMAALVREGSRIEFPEVARGVQPFSEIIERAGRELTLAVLGQTLTSGGEAGGSYALGQVHNQVRMDLVLSDARALERTLTEQFLRPLVHLNLGPNVPVPLWHFLIEQPEDLDATATRVETLGRAGLRIPSRWAYEKFGIPAPEDDEEVLAPTGGGGFGVMANAQGSGGRAPASVRRGRGSARPVQGRGRAPAQALHAPDEGLLLANEAEAVGLGPWELFEALNADPPPELSGPLPEDALAWLGERRVVDQGAWDALSPAGRQRSWWVTGLSQQRTALLANALIDVVRGGQGEFEFLDRLESLGISVPESGEPGAGQIPAWQARLVHRNNRFSAYHAQRWQAIERDRALRPYVQHVCGSEPCPICDHLCGRVFALNAAAPIAGQLHHGCKCSQVSVSQIEAEREGLRVEDSTPDVPLMPDDWRYDRRDAYYLERDGGGPVTDAGRADAELLAAQPRIQDLLS